MDKVRITGSRPQAIRVRGVSIPTDSTLRVKVLSVQGSRVVVASVQYDGVIGILPNPERRSFRLSVEVLDYHIVPSGPHKGATELDVRFPERFVQPDLAQAAAAGKPAPAVVQVKVSRTVKQDGDNIYLVSMGDRTVAVPQRLRVTDAKENLQLCRTGTSILVDGLRYEVYYEEGFQSVAEKILKALVAKTAYRVGASSRLKMSDGVQRGTFLVTAREKVAGTEYQLTGVLEAERGYLPGQFKRAHGNFFLNTEGCNVRFTSGTLDVRAFISALAQGPLKATLVSA
ncbi:MAG: hypothetical protein NT099_08730 [Candidatus Saganbacteria bacterium]|nr:hypothetical protein [Candidatus Saganbacteria bacterium]